MVREMTNEERQRAKEKRQMNTVTMTEEVILHSAMKRNNLTVKEAVEAMEIYGNDKEFYQHLDMVYANEVTLEE